MKTNRPSHRRPRIAASGFTLIEMVLVLGIISVLAGLGIYSLVGVVEDSEMVRAEADMKTIETNLIRYKTKARMFPTTEQGLRALVEEPKSGPAPRSWTKSMEADALLDPWQVEYQYARPGKRSGRSYDLWSNGPDGIEGTEDDFGNF